MVRDDGNQLRGKIMRGRGNETLIGLGKELLGIYCSMNLIREFSIVGGEEESEING